MGFLGKIFGQDPQYPDLASNSAAASKLAAVRSNLEQLIQEVNDKMEVIPTEAGAYVFLGKPPKKFGIAWIEGDKIKSFKTLMEEHGLTGKDVVKISDELRAAYVKNIETARFHAKVADRDIVVTPSEPLENDVREILSRHH